MRPRVIPRRFAERLILWDAHQSSAANAKVHEDKKGRLQLEAFDDRHCSHAPCDQEQQDSDKSTDPRPRLSRERLFLGNESRKF
jgi:hypothetical protein